jgi:hypothetical protein
MIAIDPRYLDVDFPSEKKFTFGFDVPDPADASKFFAGPFFEDVVPVMTESQLREAAERLDASKGGLEYMVTRIYNQKSEGSCVANAGGQAHEIKQAIQFGRENVTHLSAISIYDIIGRSAGSGSMTSDCLDEGLKTGFIPLNDETNIARFGADAVHPNTGFRQKKGAKTGESRLSFKYGEHYAVRSVAGLLTAGMLGHPSVVGRRGHSICYTRPIWSNGWKYPYPNSWDYDWGQAFGDMTGGWGFDSMSNIQSSAGWAYVVCSVIVPQWYKDMISKAKGEG